MKIKPGFEIQSVCGQNILMGMGEENIDFSKVIVLNDSSLFLWKKLEEGINSIPALVEALRGEYEVDAATAERDVTALVDQLAELGIIEK